MLAVIHFKKSFKVATLSPRRRSTTAAWSAAAGRRDSAVAETVVAADSAEAMGDGADASARLSAVGGVAGAARIVVVHGPNNLDVGVVARKDDGAYERATTDTKDTQLRFAVLKGSEDWKYKNGKANGHNKLTFAALKGFGKDEVVVEGTDWELVKTVIGYRNDTSARAKPGARRAGDAIGKASALCPRWQLGSRCSKRIARPRLCHRPGRV